jgi:hypothetical protein
MGASPSNLGSFPLAAARNQTGRVSRNELGEKYGVGDRCDRFGGSVSGRTDAQPQDTYIHHMPRLADVWNVPIAALSHPSTRRATEAKKRGSCSSSALAVALMAEPAVPRVSPGFGRAHPTPLPLIQPRKRLAIIALSRLAPWTHPSLMRAAYSAASMRRTDFNGLTDRHPLLTIESMHDKLLDGPVVSRAGIERDSR